MRRQRCRELNRQLPGLLESLPTSLADPKRPAEPQLFEALEKARRLLQREWSAVSRRIDESMKRYESMRLPLQYVLRDIHGQHLLFQPCEESGSCLATGLIDFDAVRVDTPIADWARWIGSFAASRSEETWNRVLADLADPRPFPKPDSVLPLGILPIDGLPIDRGERSQNSRWLPSGRTVVAMARELAFATAWISLANWLVWIAGGERDFSAATERVTQRITKWVFFCESESLGSLG